MQRNPNSHDLIFRRATLIDGSGAASRVCDVAIDGDRISAIGELQSHSATKVVNAEGLVLTPGFIDVHTHDDGMALHDPAMTPKVTQGVTTVVTGNCGLSIPPLVTDRLPPAPLELLGDQKVFRFPRFADYLRAVEDKPPSVNIAPMVGHTTLRVTAMATLDRGATAQEIEHMKRLLQEALDDGVIGISSGLFYPPARPAPPEEIVALLKVAAPTGAVYTTHMRDEGDDVDKSLEESFDSARAAGISLVISHHKTQFKRNHGRSRETLAMIDRAGARQEVALDVYPYIAGSTSLLPELVEKSDRVIVTWSEAHPEAKGRDLSELIQQWACSAGEAVDRLVPAGAIYFNLAEDDMRRILCHPNCMVGSDGIPGNGSPHPRLWGTFPRVLGHYARDLGLMPFEAAVHKMTGLPAKTFRLQDRGHVETGFFADLVLFDPKAIGDAATFEAPMQPAHGIRMVLVNGDVVLENGLISPRRPGRILRRGA